MNSHLHQVKSFVHYWLDAVDHHSLHSPFLFEFYTKVLRGPGPGIPDYIELQRQQWMNSDQVVEVVDFGGGSLFTNSSTRPVSQIAKESLSPARYSSLYLRMIHYYRCHHILELGTSLGINTMYLAQYGTHTVTMEGAPEIARLAQNSFADHGLTNITVVCGNIDDTLPAQLEDIPQLDFVFLDANHRYEPTIRYVRSLIPKMANPGAIVLDDIHRSKEMERAWQEVKDDKRIHCTVDLFRCGIAFVNASMEKQHVVMQY